MASPQPEALASVVEKAWQRQVAWSQLAAARASAIRAWRVRNLLLVILGAACSAATFSHDRNGWTTLFGLTGAVALALAATVQSTQLTDSRVREHVTARAAAESAKSCVLRYLVGTAPFDGPDRDDRLDDAMTEISRRASGVAAEVALLGSAPRPLPEVSGIGDYLERRARDQRRFHFDRLAHHHRLEQRWRLAEVAATLLAAFLTAIGTSVQGGGHVNAWVGVATTVAAAVSSHRAASQHGRIAASYALTVEELDHVIDRFDPATASPADAADLVARIEAILAKQNEAWASLAT